MTAWKCFAFLAFDGVVTERIMIDDSTHAGVADVEAVLSFKETLPAEGHEQALFAISGPRQVDVDVRLKVVVGFGVNLSPSERAQCLAVKKNADVSFDDKMEAQEKLNLFTWTSKGLVVVTPASVISSRTVIAPMPELLGIPDADAQAIEQSLMRAIVDAVGSARASVGSLAAARNEYVRMVLEDRLGQDVVELLDDSIGLGDFLEGEFGFETSPDLVENIGRYVTTSDVIGDLDPCGEFPYVTDLTDDGEDAVDGAVLYGRDALGRWMVFDEYDDHQDGPFADQRSAKMAACARADYLHIARYKETAAQYLERIGGEQ